MATLFVLSSLAIGGSERKTVRAVNALHGRGHRVHLAWLDGPETLRHEIDHGVPAICLERSGKFSWSALGRLRHYAESQGITRIVCVNLYPLLYAKALRLLMGSAAPSCVIMVNATEISNKKAARHMALYAPLIRRADRIVFGCAYQLGLWVNRYRLSKDLCSYIHNGVDSDHFSLSALGPPGTDHRVEFDLHNDDFVVGIVGKLRPEKQQGDLIEAVARLRARGVCVIALLVGGGECELALRKQAAKAGIDSYIRFFNDIQDVRPVLAAMDIFVLSSVAVETFSNAALEAMAMGRPVVLSDVGGAREMVWEGINGQIYPPHDVERLVAILENLAADPAAARKMGEEARRIVVEEFSFSHMVDKYECLCVN